MNNEIVRVGGDGHIQLDFMRLLRAPLESLLDEEVAEAVSVLTLAGAAFKERETELKERLRQIVMERGDRVTEKTYAFTARDVTVNVSVPAATYEVSEANLRAAMRAANVAEEDVYDRLPTLNKAKLELAIARGRFTDEQVASFTTSKEKTPSVSVKTHVAGLTKDELLHGRNR